VLTGLSSACGSPDAAKPQPALDALVDKLVAGAKAGGGVAREVGPGGGTVTDDATGAAIEIPAGALPQAAAGDTYVVSIVPYAGAALTAPEGFSLAGDLVDIRIQSVREGASVQPVAAVRITVPYAGEAAAARLAVGNYHGSAWVTQPTESVDTKAHLVTAPFTQLSPFGALQAANTAPLADAQAVATDEDTDASGTLTGTDADGDLLTYTVAPGGTPQHGAVTLQVNGDFAYTPDADFHGSDQFSFVVNDGTADSPAAVVTITVNPVNDAPAASAKSVSVNEDAAYSGTLAGTDVENDPLGFSLAPGGGAQHGTLSLQTNGSFQYTPAANYNGSDQFSFRVSDGTLYSPAAVVSITVNAVNDAPSANGLTLSTTANTAVAATVTGSDLENSALTYAVSTAPGHGSVAITAATGALVYTPAADYAGADQFYVTANDGAADSAPALVTVKIIARRYVMPTAAGSGDGSSWTNATADLQGAVNAVAAAGLGEVWLAKGTYRSTGTGALLTMANNVDVYGGFAGTETALAQRGTVDAGATVLSGDTDASGTFTTGDAYHVVLGATARLDGLTITGGNAVNAGSGTQGAGIYQNTGTSTLTLTNVKLTGNHANGDGGAIYNSGLLVIRNSRIENNSGTNSSGGIFSYYGRVTMESSIVRGNSTGFSGGGLYIMYAPLTLSNSLIDANTSASSGAGLFLSNSTATITNTQISHNTASQWYGGGIQTSNAQLVLTHVQFISNSAPSSGGGLSLQSSSTAQLRNTTFWGNTAPSGADMSGASSSTHVHTCTQQNLAAYGTAVSQATTNPFVARAASGEYFFDPAHGCADWGDAATAATAFTPTGTTWQNWTSEIAGLTLEGGTSGVAAGMLRLPDDVWIRSFTVSATNLAWQTNAGATSCTLTNSATTDVVQLNGGSLPSGSQSHAFASGTVVTLTCAAPKSYVKTASGTVP
jgi:VCBS repeat-containing protein